MISHIETRKALWKAKTTEGKIDHHRHPGSVWYSVLGPYGPVRVFYTRFLKQFFGGRG